MYLNILKRDLKRKKAMNIILLLFIILATMFVSSSANNIINVTMALDNYFDMAKVPDYMIMTIDKMLEADVEEIMDSTTSIESYTTEKVLFMSSNNFIFENKDMKIPSGTSMLQSDKELALNYFLADKSVLQEVKKGEVYLTEGFAEDLGLKFGDKICIEVEDVKKEFTFVGEIKDAALGAEMSSMYRYIISEEEFEDYITNETIRNEYGGNLYYIHTTDLEQTKAELSKVSENFPITADRELLKFMYIFNMVVTGMLLVVSVILILIAFVVLRFTITFTLSEEFREIGVMKAIGISNWKIRRLYLVKYTAISIIGATIGLLFGFPFGQMLMSVSSKSIIISGEATAWINVLCTPVVIGIVLLFCYGCTSKVKNMTPIDAIRNGQTGERFSKKSFMNLGRSKLSATSFLAVNDLVSSPKRYSIMILTFFLCLSLMLMLSTTVFTMKSGTLVSAFGVPAYDISLVLTSELLDYMDEGGQEELKADLDALEEQLAQNGMPASCSQEMAFSLPVICEDKKVSVAVRQGMGISMDKYEYTEGTMPIHTDEIAIT
ncbi:MAG: ABC transporter permease, partial [Lachnospiraceae bacterium]|nr:ABC transporter permease [Lachnospiraceae bacterium]